MQKYLFRDEGARAIDYLKLGKTGEEAVGNFFQGLCAISRRVLNDEVEIVSCDLTACQEWISTTANGYKTISMDSYFSGDFQVRVSRVFLPGGKRNIGIVERPGFSTLQQQVARIPPGTYNLVDDMMYTGRTVRPILEQLGAQGVSIAEVLVSVRVGCPELDIPVRGMVSYEPHEIRNRGIDNPRDFLAGAHEGGLVVHYPWPLPSGTIVRTPYVFPFVDPSARIGVPRERALEFSRRVWELNCVFWGQFPSVRVCDTAAAFAYGVERLGIPADEPMERFCERMLDLLNFPEIEFNVPGQGVIWLDLNDTLINIDRLLTVRKGEWMSFVQEIEGQGWMLGLCSDSPHEALKKWGERHGIHGPIIAEGGALLNGIPVSTDNPMPVEELKDLIREWADEQGIHVFPDVLSAEFQESSRALGETGIGFGAGRTQTLAVFCRRNGESDPELTKRLGEFVERTKIAERFGIDPRTIDCSPSYGFFAFCSPHKKGKILRAVGWELYKQGKSCYMIGNSTSDLAYCPPLCQTGIVGDGTLAAQKGADLLASAPCTQGVVELVSSIVGM